MRIVHLVSQLDPADGGPPVVAARLAAGQARHLGLQGPGDPDHGVAVLSGPTRQGAVAQLIDGVPGTEAVEFRPMDWLGRERPALAKRLGEADAVHIHGVWGTAFKAAAAAAHRAGVPYVVTPHGMLDPWSLSQKKWKKRAGLYLLGYRRMLQRAAFLHLLNDEEKRLIEPLSLHTPVEVIPNGIFMEEVDPLPEPGRFHAAHPDLRGRPFVLFLSRLHYKKGLDRLARGFAALCRLGLDRATEDPLASVQLVVAGPDGGERGPFESLVAELDRAEPGLGLAGRVHIIGPVYGQAKYEALRDAAAFTLISRQEGFSMAITEALACELPVVITEACHFPQVAQAGCGFIVSPDPEAVAEALASLLGDPAARLAMGRAGRRLVAERFTWDRIAESSLAAYHKHANPA